MLPTDLYNGADIPFNAIAGSIIMTCNVWIKILTDEKEVIFKMCIRDSFTAGSDDPVGAFGKNVIRVYEKYKDAGIKDVSIHLYKGDRHEILNEVDRQNVYQDILAWIEEKNRR